MQVTVRPIQSSDQERWRELWRAYQAFYEVELPQTVTETTWLRLLDDREPVFGLVAEKDRTVIGITHYLFHLSTWLENQTCYLQDLFVDPQARGKGVGRALIEAVYARADLVTGGRVYWLTHESNAAARQVYDQLARHSGFIVYRRNIETTYDD
jgi:GNAT superfamily N-acetyltransferase